ncbi:hypothetical protein ADICEAN_02223 [Cesiribacter andamanensis AMV16]|uniref:Outer membrane protein beta-barrel domain-containing protein n=2 Tax=Cesiribacter TaxID=1133570 RepID=M7NVX2_9BACT|nr:hypothetical protein ADICEAN_02223 [Cesiribacter andamanensis AMV16]
MLLLLFCLQPGQAQVVFKDTTQTAVRARPIGVTLGVGMGYAAPRELNERIKQELSSQWAIAGSTDLNLYVMADVAVRIPLKNAWSAGPLLEGAVASKSLQDVSANMETRVYSLWRFSPGLAVHYRGQLPNAYWYISPAFQYHSLRYNSLLYGKGYDNKASGLRLELGYATQGWTADLRYRLIATIMSPGRKGTEQPALDFSGIAFGMGLSFP